MLKGLFMQRFQAYAFILCVFSSASCVVFVFEFHFLDWLDTPESNSITVII